MFKFQTVTPPGGEAECVTSAFFRFLDLNGLSATDAAWVETEYLREGVRRTITLWSAEAVQAFEEFLKASGPARFGEPALG